MGPSVKVARLRERKNHSVGKERNGFSNSPKGHTFVMRNDPQIPLSDALAFISWPRPRTTADATIAFLYWNQESLQRDYERAASWKRLPQGQRLTRSLYLEKTRRDGLTWFNFGRRIYCGRRPCGGNANSRRIPIEPPQQRIAVPMRVAGNNRRQVELKMRRLTSLSVIFATYDGGDPQGIERAINYLSADCLGAAPGTEPISLSGISVLGRLIQFGKEAQPTSTFL